MIKFKRFTQGLLGSNTYVVWDDATLEAAVIDAGNDTALIKSVTDTEKLKLKYIILTHAHYDHIHFLPEYKETFQSAKVVIHELDDEMLPNPRLNASVLFGPAHVYDRADIAVKDEDVLNLGNETLKIVHTPGHTPGGICILAGDMLFSGDTLFYAGFGRTDLGAGDVKLMASSIEKLYSLDGNITVYPGHGTKTTIAKERDTNPYLYF
jgi:glyoxylase-like metal-dependent hydrolase (beta-lactamase superfamily II)